MGEEIKIDMGINSTVKKDMDGVVRDVNKGAKQVESGFGGMFKGIVGGIGFGMVASGIRSLIGYVSDLKDKAEQVEFSTKNFQILTAVASDSGVKVDELSASLSKLVKAKANIGDDTTAQDAFRALGISIQQVRDSEPDALFEMIAKGFAETGDKAALFDLFGKSANKLIPTLKELSAGFDALANREPIISDADIARIDEADDKLNKLSRTIKGRAAIVLSNWLEEAKKTWADLGEWRMPDVIKNEQDVRGNLKGIKAEKDTATATPITHGRTLSDMENALLAGPSKEETDAYDKALKKQEADRVESEKRIQEEKKRTAEIEAGFAEQAGKQKAEAAAKRVKDAEARLAAIEKRAQARESAIADAQAKADADGAHAAELRENFMDPSKGRAARNKAREDKRNADRQKRIDAEMEGRIARGVTGRGVDEWRAMKAAEAKADADKMEAARLAKQQAADIAIIKDTQAKLLQVGGAAGGG